MTNIFWELFEQTFLHTLKCSQTILQCSETFSGMFYKHYKKCKTFSYSFWKCFNWFWTLNFVLLRSKYFSLFLNITSCSWTFLKVTLFNCSNILNSLELLKMFHTFCEHFKKCKTFLGTFFIFYFIRNTVNCSKTNLEFVLETIWNVWRIFFGNFFGKHFNRTLWNVLGTFLAFYQEHCELVSNKFGICF